MHGFAKYKTLCRDASDPVPRRRSIAGPVFVRETLRSVIRFNRICTSIALAWVLGFIPLTLRLRPSYQDVATFYTAAVVARVGAWDALYPLVGQGTGFRVGDYAVPKPGLARLAAERQVTGSLPFLYPPTAAVLLCPLGYLSFPAAYWAWAMLLCLSSWGLAVFAGKAYVFCAGKHSRVQGIVVLLTAFSLLTYRSIRVGNVSPLVALCLIVSVFSFMGQLKAGGPITGGLALMVGGGLKLASAALVPLAVAMRQWRTLAVAAILGLLLLLTYRMAGRATFDEYLTRIAPTLGSSTDMAANKSLQGFLLRVTGVSPLPPALRYACRTLQGVSLAGLLWLIFRLPYAAWREPPRVFAASAALIGWMLIFSPLCWEHYFSYLCPLWGWLVWEASQGPWRRIAAWATIATQWVPLPVNPWLRVPEPINSYMLWGLVVMCALAAVRLMAPTRQYATGFEECRQ